MKMIRAVQAAIAAAFAVSFLIASSPAQASAAQRTPGVNVSYSNVVIRVKPRTVELFSDVSLTKLRWTRLTRTSGTAKGVLRINTCRPNCADGHISRAGVTVKFSKVIRFDGELAFTRVVTRDSRGRTRTYKTVPQYYC